MTRKKSGKVLFQGLESGMKLFRWAVWVLVVLFWVSGIQNVQPTNVGLLTRFGKLLPNSVQSPVREPGLVLALPYPIDQLIQVPKGQEQRLEVSEVWAALDLPVKNNKIDPILEGYCLTGDNNIVQTRMVVKYVIVDPVAYEFKISDASTMVHDMTLAALTETIAEWKVDEVLQLQRRPAGESGGSVLQTEKLDAAVARRTQARLDAVESGIRVNVVEFVAMHYPRHVNKEFENVQTTRIANETSKRRAEEFAGTERFRSESLRTMKVDEARAREHQLISEAMAEKESFMPLYEEYQKAPALAWQRIYMEAMEQVWKNVGRLDFVPANSRIILTDEQEGQP